MPARASAHRETRTRSRAARRSGPRRPTRARPASSRVLDRKELGDGLDGPLRRVVYHLFRGARVARLARLVEPLVVRDRLLEALAAREDDAVVALSAPEETLDLGEQARPARGLVTRRVEFPSHPQVAVDVLLAGEPLELGEQRAHARKLGRPDRRDADARGEAFEPEPRRIDLLEVLAGQPAHHRPARLADLDEPDALELGQPE